MSNNDAFYLNQSEPQKGCLLAMRSLLLNFNDDVTETTKYGMPCYCKVNKPFCYLWADKVTHEPNFLIVKGREIEHPMLETGKRSKMKILRVNPSEDLPVSTIHEVLSLAWEV